MNKDSEENDKNSNLGNEISCGELLARTRQEKDLNTEEIAKELRINVSIIEMMEGNEFQSIGAPVFVKGYLRQYANILGLSADSILEEYNQLNPDKNSLPIVNKAVEKISKYVLTPKLILVGVSFFLILLIIFMIVSSLSQIETLPNQEAKIQDMPIYDSPSVMDETNAIEMQEPLLDELKPIDDQNSPSVMDETNAIEMQEPLLDELKPIDDQNSPSVMDETNAIEMQEPLLDELKPIDDQNSPSVMDETNAIEMQEPLLDESEALYIESTVLNLTIEYSGLCWTEIYDVNGQLLFYALGNFDKAVVVNGIGPLDVLFGAVSEVLSLRVDNQSYPLPESSRPDEVLRFSVSNL